jgi:hypothetical protein
MEAWVKSLFLTNSLIFDPNNPLTVKNKDLTPITQIKFLKERV